MNRLLLEIKEYRVNADIKKQRDDLVNECQNMLIAITGDLISHVEDCQALLQSMKKG